MRALTLTTAMVVGISTNAAAQTGIPSAAVHGLHGDFISLSGDIGTYGELYSISGRDSRRPSSTARLYFRPTISFYDAMTVSFNFLLSTEGSSRSVGHQVNQINQLGIRPQWEWGYANAGDFTESFTPYTLNGILMRGGGVTINPGHFRFSAVGGYTRRTGASGDGSGFDRYLYGGKIGIGRDGDSFFDVLFLRTRDIPSRFQTIQPDSVTPPDSTQVGTMVNPYQESPQENLVVGFVGALKMFENAVSLNGEFSGSAFTRDMNSAEFSNEKIPSFIRGVYTPRLSSSADYAYTLNMNVNLSQVEFKAGYRRIGPGYNSLGVSSLVTDQREIMFGTNVRFSRWSTSFTWTRQNDNLLEQKLNMTIRQTYSGIFNLRPFDIWSVGVIGNVLTMRNYAIGDVDALIDFITLNFGTTQSIMLGREGFFRMASVTYMFQKSADKNPLRVNNGTLSHTVGINGSASPSTDITIVPSLSIIASLIGQSNWATIQAYNITAQYRALENAFVTSLTVGISQSESISSLQTNLIASYRLTPSNTMTLTIRRTGFNSGLPSTTGYNEYTTSLAVSQRL